jgi:hypothetical protein
VSESDDDYASDDDDNSSVAGRYANPSDFLKAFGGYATDDEDPDDADEEEFQPQGTKTRHFQIILLWYFPFTM